MNRGKTLRHVVRNLDQRLLRVEQILPTLATKADLAGVPTREDPKGFLTKDDAERFATKDDLERFATKDDLTRFATKEDLERFATKEDLERFATKDDLKRFATKDDLAPLPTRGEMHAAIQDAVGQVRILLEAQSDQLRLIAETLSAHLARHDKVVERLDGHDVALEALDLRVHRLEARRPPGAR